MKSLSIKFYLFLFLYINYSYAQEYTSKLNTIKKSYPNAVNNDTIHKAYFASGCFWCVEVIYESLKGVIEVNSGYSGGFTKNPTYQLVNTETTGHAETIEVIYNPKIISFSQLVNVYFGSQDIEQINGQGPDNGSQYRSIIFFQNEEQKTIANNKIISLEEKFLLNVAAELYPFQRFWIGEDYHQDFKKNNMNNIYIIKVSNPRFKKFSNSFEHLINNK
ncbi:MAG: peptide-methionine (S)-S-oxide reductase MsrA [Flavobacteriaceae bacterium]|jgi:peptide-methionine (S)-S-oxide reductase|nr:peptide-methionine (S)-S-oxide reductase MsrA [Flavobacteriaceae bacterium]MBT4113877.1 peptide-methionine (S)-S-oxide reductase MsrA [Flavobacteriaceae bacterium]MBT4613764.1 peptide-methionine (S)-S-oxide reductase MsrA [Flavobacteriaceae bacterium]MBT5246344.1 peptide-methionine (S)-S-oxide reductase MsrA [Flavobacteriaceae bacterium]MBT5650397.1 peptide-methionine (S)-S-oxide reductase MsrA [Flavobacteriaceae bacterium]